MDLYLLVLFKYTFVSFEYTQTVCAVYVCADRNIFLSFLSRLAQRMSRENEQTLIHTTNINRLLLAHFLI